ncbi:MAG: C40 family peptidase [Oscillospiraceae bacterium]|nr:C40 family peptidase [Oscillospiraceae bacterium]
MEATEKAASGIVAFVKRHPVGVALFAVLLLVLVLLQSCMSSMVSMGNGALGAVSASTYQAEDADIRAAEAAYCELEAELQEKLDNYENDHDYDEYHFDLDDIEHDPYVLISILSAWHEGAWTIDEVQGTLEMLFEKQYILTEDVVRETRYRTETRTGTRLVYDEDLDEYVEEEYEYEVQVPYSYYTCTVTLENFNLSHLPIYIMGEEKLSRYALYMATLGNRTDLFPTSSYVGKYTSEPFLYEVPEEYLANETFAAIYEEAQKYIGYPYVWGGYKPSTSFDCSGYVSWVYNQCGWDFGRLGAQGLYNISTRVRNPQPGDLVFFTGTYDTPGVSHVGIYVGDGWMLHCGDPIGYADLSASYWQSHFYAYGRLS